MEWSWPLSSQPGHRLVGDYQSGFKWPRGQGGFSFGERGFPSFPPFPALPSCAALGEPRCLSHFLISLRWGGATLPPLLLSASFLKGPQLCLGGQRAYLNTQVLQTPCSWVPT